MLKLLSPFKLTSLVLLTGWLLFSYGCKKGKSNPPAPSDASAIIGKWLLNKEHIRIYTTSGQLVRDTTDAFGVITPGVNSYQTFDKNGTSIFLRNADTSAIETYTISGHLLKTYENSDNYEAQNIVVLNGTNLELEAVFIGSDQSPVWGLDPTVSYKYIQDDYYTRQ